MLTIGSIMTRDLVTVAPDRSLGRALWLMRERKLRHLPVTDHGRLVGVLSERDLLDGFGRHRRRSSKTEMDAVLVARDRMSTAVETVSPDERVTVAARRLHERRVGCLPVVDGGRLVGMASEADFLRIFVRACRAAGHPPDLDPSIGSVMSKDVIVAELGETAGAAFERCRAKGIRHLPVVSDGWLMGIVSDHDLAPVVSRAEGDVRKVVELMTKDFVGVSPEARLSDAAERMLRDGFHALPVLEAGGLKGIVTSVDALRRLGAADERVLEKAWSDESALRATRIEEC